MYRTFDEDVFLAPETIISGIVASAGVFDDLSEVDSGAFSETSSACAGPIESDLDDEGLLDGGEPPVPHWGGTRVEAWSRHARGANGFGGE